MDENATRCFKCGVDSMKCKKCGNLNTIKSVKTVANKQRYYCKKCKFRFEKFYSYKAYSPETNNKIIALTKEGVGIRSTARLLKIALNTVQNSTPNKIITDKLKNYKYLRESKLHSTKFRGINHIERMNLKLRTHLKRLNRRTIAFSRSVLMLSAVLKIYFWTDFK